MHRFKIRLQVECGDYNKEIKFCEDANSSDWVAAFHESQFDKVMKAAKAELAKRNKETDAPTQPNE